MRMTWVFKKISDSFLFLGIQVFKNYLEGKVYPPRISIKYWAAAPRLRPGPLPVPARPQTRRLAGGRHLLLDCKEIINNYWKSCNKIFYRDTVDSNGVSMRITPLSLHWLELATFSCNYHFSDVYLTVQTVKLFSDYP